MDPNAFIATHRTRQFRPCEIDPFILHLQFAPHEIESICGLIEAVSHGVALPHDVLSAPAVQRLAPLPMSSLKTASKELRVNERPLSSVKWTHDQWAHDQHADAMEARKTRSQIMQRRRRKTTSL
jgi:hypothetical protein